MRSNHAGRLSDKMSSELGYYLRVIAELFSFLGGIYSSTGFVDYMLFECDGKKYCSFMNHNGVTKTKQLGETVNPDALMELKITQKEGTIGRVFALCSTEYDLEDNLLKAALPGGTFILYQYE